MAEKESVQHNQSYHRHKPGASITHKCNLTIGNVARDSGVLCTDLHIFYFQTCSLQSQPAQVMFVGFCKSFFWKPSNVLHSFVYAVRLKGMYVFNSI